MRRSIAGGVSRRPDGAAGVNAHQRYAVALAALVLHRHGDRAVAVHGEVADAQTVQLRSQPESILQPPAREVEVGERGLHGVEVEHGAVVVRMGADAAVGGDQRRAVGHQRDLVRTDAVGGELADLAVAVVGVANADHAAAGREIVLAGQQMAAVGRERAVAVEVAPPGGVDAAQSLPLLEVDHHREGTRTAGEDHALRRVRAKRGAVAAAGQRDIEGQAAIGAKAGREITLDLVGAATDVERPRALPRANAARKPRPTSRLPARPERKARRPRSAARSAGACSVRSISHRPWR
jgi:hypothetical protein